MGFLTRYDGELREPLVWRQGSHAIHSSSRNGMRVRTSLVIQWLRICLPMQGTWVRSLVRELGSHRLWGSYQNCCGCHTRPSTKTMLGSDLNTLLLETPAGGGVGVEGCQWLLSALPVCTVFISFKPCKMKMGKSNKIPKYVCSPQLSICS